MTAFDLPNADQWGYSTPPTTPDQLATRLQEETSHALNGYEALPEGPEPCNDKSGFCRVSVAIPISAELLDQLMNGRSGYRAHYSVSVEYGEAYNNLIVQSLAPMIEEKESLYSDKFSRELCHASLGGSYTKVWYSKELTDPSAIDYLEYLPEEITLDRWSVYWAVKPIPRKGLLAPLPRDTSILLNGTFVDADARTEYEQKPCRSAQLHESGWT